MLDFMSSFAAWHHPFYYQCYYKLWFFYLHRLLFYNQFSLKKKKKSWVPVAHACDSIYLRGWRSGGSRFEASPVIQFARPISKTTRVKLTGAVAQVIERLLLQAQSLEFKAHSHQNKNKNNKDCTLKQSNYITSNILKLHANSNPNNQNPSS
jgi:hypothetical protein